MKVLLQIVIPFFGLFYQICDAAYLVPGTVITQLNSSYVLIIREDGIQPKECYIDDGTNKYMIDLIHEGVKPEPQNKKTDHIYNAEDLDIIKSLGNGICGFKMDKVSKTQKWTLTIVDEKGKSYNKTTFVIIRETDASYTKTAIKIGDPISVSCASQNKNIDYCEIYHPNGEVVLTGTESCYFTVKLTKVTDLGLWKCLLGYKSSMVPVERQYEFIQTEFNTINTWHNDTETRVHLGCSISNPKLKPGNGDYCVMVRPDGKQFKLFPGLATDRYTALNTNLTHSICSLEIVKPLESTEWGIWRCEVHSGPYEPIGGFITLPTRSNRVIRSVPGIEAKVPKDMFLHVNSSMTVSCRVPYSSSYCYMRGPDGVLYPIKDDRSITLGLCKFTKAEVKLTDNGTWLCGFAKKSGASDDVYNFQVHVAEALTIRPELQSVEARDGGSAYLKCTTKGLGDFPVQYCRFLSPDGHMYQITDNDQSNDRIVYDGRGLEYGDCGIKIRKMELSDIGKWTCITRVGAQFTEDEVYTTIDLAITNNLSLASVLAI
ncbi:hypothetical protein CBL_11680 [Carabus blaptoides fortunei]